MASIQLKHIFKTYEGGTRAVRDFSLDIADQEFIVLVGPSGCGKSTILRMVAGLEDITAGDLLIGGTPANDVLPRDRNIAMVFQNYALYPHMTVYKNMEFCLKMRKVPAWERTRRVEETARLMQIEELLQRKPSQLSGGQRQRVALGRAMIRQPEIFLFDEPLSNLDAKLRIEMRHTITLLHRQVRTTFLYVTHDQTEAMTMADRIVVMKDGMIQQCDTPQALYRHPVNSFVAGFIGTPEINLIPAHLEVEKRQAFLCFENGRCPLPERPGRTMGLSARHRRAVLAGIRPEAMIALPREAPAAFGLCGLPQSADIVRLEEAGAERWLYLTAQGRSFTVSAKTNNAAFRPGDTVALYFYPDQLHLFDAETGQSLGADCSCGSPAKPPAFGTL